MRFHDNTTYAKYLEGSLSSAKEQLVFFNAVEKIVQQTKSSCSFAEDKEGKDAAECNLAGSNAKLAMHENRLFFDCCVGEEREHAAVLKYFRAD